MRHGTDQTQSARCLALIVGSNAWVNGEYIRLISCQLQVLAQSDPLIRDTIINQLNATPW
jgi:hypothetical protein